MAFLLVLRPKPGTTKPKSETIKQNGDPDVTTEGTAYAVRVYIANAAGGYDGTLSASVPLTIQLGPEKLQTAPSKNVQKPTVSVGK